MIAVVLLAILQSATWNDLRADGWDYVGEADTHQMVAFTRPFQGGAKRLWVRMEFAPDHPNAYGYRSMRTLVEADCDAGRLRSLQSTSFRLPNLSGESIADTSPAAPFYPPPDTIHEIVFDAICDADT